MGSPFLNWHHSYWSDKIMTLVHTSSHASLINDKEEDLFVSSKGLR